MRRALFLAPLLVAIVHCGTSSGSGFDGQSSNGGASSGGGSSGLTTSGGPAPTNETECTKMDLVFVVDDSGSMGEEQANLAANFPAFIKILDDTKSKNGVPLNYRIAVTTTGRDLSYTVQPPPPFGPLPMNEKGDNGAFRNKKECGATKRWLDRGDANVSSVFSCLAKVGTGGPSVEMPLEALDLAFGARTADATNAGFRRDDALLGVVILSDEDDCSRKDNNFTIGTESCSDMKGVAPLEGYVSMLDTVAKGKGRWAASVIAGPGPGTCKSSFGEADDAKRLRSFVALSGANGVFSSICDGDLTSGLKRALETFDSACKRLPPAVK